MHEFPICKICIDSNLLTIAGLSGEVTVTLTVSVVTIVRAFTMVCVTVEGAAFRVVFWQKESLFWISNRKRVYIMELEL